EDGSVRQPVARSNFNETAEFAIVTTDAEGRGKLKFTLPDSTTEWTVTGRGVTRATELGEGNATFTTFREIEASLRLPAAVTEGDKMDSVVTVRNAGTQKRSVETNITVEGGDGSGTTTLELAGGEESTASRPIKVADATNLKVKVDAKAGDVSDSIERSVGIRPAGSFVTVAESAVVRDQALLELNISNFNQLRRRAFEIVVTPSLQSDVLEDAGSDVKPRLSGPFIDTTGWAVTRGETALERMGFLGRFSAGNEAAIAKQRARVQDAIAKIAAERLSDGSLNWAGQLNTSLDKHFTPERTSDAATSARALAFLGRARTAGFTVADEVFDKLVSWLADRLRKEENAADRARIVYALAEAKAADFELVNRLQRAKAELTDVALAHLALADIRLNRRDLAAEIVELLQKRAKTGKAEMPWGGADDGAEATGLIVSVLSQLDPLQPTLASAVDRLRSARRGWLGDRGEAAAVRGLAAFSLHSKMDTSEFTLTIEVNGENVKELKSSDVAGPVAFSIDAAKIRDKNEIRAKLAGRGEVSLYVAASGYTKEFKPNASAFAGMTRRVEPAYLIYRGKTIPRGYSIVDGPYTTITNEVNNLPVGAEANVETSFSLREKEQNFADYIYLEDPIPAGCEIVPNSIQGSFERVVVRDGSVIAAFPPKSRSGWVRFRILGVRTGEYMYGPTLVKSAYRPDRAGEGKSKKITIQPLGSKTTDEIKLTPDEMYHLGVAKFDAGERADGAKWLRLVCQESRLREEPLREATRRILQDAIERMDSTETIAAFERLRDRFTDVTLPFETVVKVGEAYITAKQAEMGDLLFRGTTAALYRSESNVAGALLREGEFMAAVTFMDQLNRIYPDFTEILNAIHQLAGLVAATANGAQTSAAKATKPPREMLLTKSSELELEFLYRSPASALAPEAAFGYLAAQLDLEHYKEVVQGCGAFAARYPDSEWLDESLYLEGYARFASGDSKNALLVLNRVVDEKFPDGSSSRGQSGYRDRAVLLRAQILHAGGDAKTAVAEYEKVKNNFTDAADAVQAFRSKQLTLAPVVTLDMQEKAELTITSKNLAKASARVYRVDLMRLYLMERNLDRMTGIDLSGIAPLIIKDLALGSTEDFTGRETKVQFELQEKGAYLVVIRSDAEAGAAPLAATTLILRTDLKLEVREDAAAGRVWVNVRDSNNASVAKADVRIVGTRDGSVRVGATDLRGVFVAEGVHGRSTVVAQVNPKDANDKEGPSFAFYKGSTELAAPAQTASEGKKDYGEFEKAATDQLRRQNFELQSRNALQIETQLLNTNIGVELKNVK
ncbi:MAG: alpha-2-macroglobulin family protein, partial [Planctomycetota bacterium]